MIKGEILREQIVRKVTSVGNGAHIFAPKEWVGEEVVIIRTPRISLKEKILKIIGPNLENVLGIYLYGSYAREEQRQDSDIDVLIISDKNFKLKEKGFEILVLKKDKIREAIKIAPVLLYSALMGAKPLINSELLKELRKNYKPRARDFKEYIKETKNIIKINEEFLDPYSIILRLRGIYIIGRLLAGKNYSYDDFKKWIFKGIKSTDKKINFDDMYRAYLRIKSGFRTSTKENDLRLLLLILKNKTQELEKKING